MKRSKRASSKGFTLPEVLVAALVTIIAFVGILFTYARFIELDEIARNTSIVLQAAQNKVESIKNTAYAQIVATFDNQTFTVAGITNTGGVVTIDDTNPKLMIVTVTVCWKQTNNRLIGEDTNLNGALNAGEDTNGNGVLDSPVQLVAYIYNE